jgi:hypothetical protein
MVFAISRRSRWLCRRAGVRIGFTTPAAFVFASRVPEESAVSDSRWFPDNR